MLNEMRSVLGRIIAAVIGVALLAAVPSALFPGWGWIATGTIAVSGASAIGAWIRRAHLKPLTDLAEVIHPVGAPPHRTIDLAMGLASEVRSALTRLERAQTTESRQRAALAHTADGVVVIDPGGSVDYANPVARLLLGDRVLDATRRITHPELEDLTVRTGTQHAPVTAELLLRTPEPRSVFASAVRLEDESCVLLLQDRTESERVDRVRRDFVANVSHELKTPVASIRALADVAAAALGDEDRETAGRFVDRLLVEAQRLSELVRDLLDLEKVEAGHELQIDRFEALQLLDAAAERARPTAEAKGVALDVSGEHRRIEADAAQLAMAVQNLVDNAVRYSDGGTVRLRVEATDGEVLISVSDEGIGIPADELPRVFERFYRVDRARARATGGTGLGLAIVKHVVENHGGSVDVRSELGAGSTFTIRLPTGAGRSGHAA